MRSVVLGIRMHSGWGALVAVSGKAAKLEILDRRRIIVADPNIAGASQPYHFASKFEIPEARKYLSNCADVSQHLAFAAIDGLVRELHRERDFDGCANAVFGKVSGQQTARATAGRLPG